MVCDDAVNVNFTLCPVLHQPSHSRRAACATSLHLNYYAGDADNVGIGGAQITTCWGGCKPLNYNRQLCSITCSYSYYYHPQPEDGI